MLYQIGPLTLDTRPISADTMARSGGGELAVKPLMNALPAREFMGESDERITLAGLLLPTKIGGLPALEMAHAMSRAGTSLPVMRGDGKVFGWFAIESVSEQHASLDRYGVGFTVKYSFNLVKVSPDLAAGVGPSGGIVGLLLSLFEGL